MPSPVPPLYQQIRDHIRNGITSGTYGAGEKLPSESELARMFGTTRITVRQALSQLVFEGLLVPRNGRGYFVAASAGVRSPIDTRHCLTFEEQVALTGRVVTYGACTFTLIRIEGEAAKRLGLVPGSSAFKLERVRMIDGRPVGLEVRYMPHEIGSHVTGEMLAHRPAHQFVSEILGERIPTLVVSITADLASPELAAVLEVPVGSPLIVRDNTHHASDGSPKVWGRSVYRGDMRTDYVLGQPLPEAAGPAAAGPAAKSRARRKR